MQCSLAGSSKTAPRILIFSIAMSADHSFYVKTIETHARAFLPLNISAMGTVYTSQQVNASIHTPSSNVNEFFCIFDAVIDVPPSTGSTVLTSIRIQNSFELG